MARIGFGWKPLMTSSMLGPPEPAAGAIGQFCEHIKCNFELVDTKTKYLAMLKS
jgi:hypothetical protein